MSIRVPQWPTTDKERARRTRFTFLLHLRPVQVSGRAIRWTHTFGLGGSSLVLLVLLVATGLMQMLVYQPVPDVAYDSVVSLERDVAFGPLVRGMHYWSANLLVLVSLLHMVRVFVTGAYFGARSFTWILGVGLLLGILASSFTGYLLPWDQRAYWAITISTGMLTYIPWIGEVLQRVVLGGPEISDATLVNFHTLHTSIIPTLLLLVAAWHFWRVRRAGGVVEPLGEPAPKVPFWPNLLVKETAQGLVVVALVVVLAAILGAPLGERANPGMSPNPAKAPWYFMGFQELLIHFPPVVAVLVVPLLALIGFLVLPYVVPDGAPEGRWFLTRAGMKSAGRVAFVSQALMVLLVVALVVLTIIGVWFRGEGMAFVWPWTGGGG